MIDYPFAPVSVDLLELGLPNPLVLLHALLRRRQQQIEDKIEHDFPDEETLGKLIGVKPRRLRYLLAQGERLKVIERERSQHGNRYTARKPDRQFIESVIGQPGCRQSASQNVQQSAGQKSSTCRQSAGQDVAKVPVGPALECRSEPAYIGRDLREGLEEEKQQPSGSLLDRLAAGASLQNQSSNENQHTLEAVRETLTGAWDFPCAPPGDSLLISIAAALGATPLNRFRQALDEAKPRARSYGLALRIAQDAARSYASGDPLPPRRQPVRATGNLTEREIDDYFDQLCRR